MYDLASLWHHVDALDLMGYGFEPCISGRAGPSAPMGGCWYNVTQAVSDYMTRFGVPASELLLGVPYYGYKWDVSCSARMRRAGSHHLRWQRRHLRGRAVRLQLRPAAATALGCHLPGAVGGVVQPGDQRPLRRQLRLLTVSCTTTTPPSLGIKYDLVNSRQPARHRHLGARVRQRHQRPLERDRGQVLASPSSRPFNPKGVGAPSLTIAPDGSRSWCSGQEPGVTWSKGGGRARGTVRWTGPRAMGGRRQWLEPCCGDRPGRHPGGLLAGAGGPRRRGVVERALERPRRLDRRQRMGRHRDVRSERDACSRRHPAALLAGARRPPVRGVVEWPLERAGRLVAGQRLVRARWSPRRR